MPDTDSLTRRKLTIADLKPRAAPPVAAPIAPPSPAPSAPAPKQKPPKLAAKPAKPGLVGKPAKPAPAAKPPPAPPPERIHGKTIAQIERQRRRLRKRKIRQRAMAGDRAAALLAQLRADHPAAFPLPPRPLATGIHHRIIAQYGCEPVVANVALRVWTARPDYIAAVAAGGPRHALDGTQEGEVSESERANAAKGLAVLQRKPKRRISPRPPAPPPADPAASSV